jgi:1,4-dihydroxy-2-naphthoate octaprenyltransferase
VRIAQWIKASRAPFFIGVMLFVCVGTAAAWHDSGAIEWLPFAACVLGVGLINGGTNLANDYFDHRTSADEGNDFPTPFSGGSRAIQDGVFTPREILVAAFVCFALAAATGVYVVLRSGWVILAIGTCGVLSGYFYTAPPFKFGYRGLGELVTGINFGLLPVVGSYYVQTLTLNWSIVLIGLAPCCFGAALLLINEMPDSDADRRAGKLHLVARMSLGSAAIAYLGLIVCAYAAIGAALYAGFAPRGTLLAFVAAPVGLLAFALSCRWARRARAATSQEDASPLQMTPAMGANVACMILTSVLLCAGYLISGTTVG